LFAKEIDDPAAEMKTPYIALPMGRQAIDDKNFDEFFL
jgi:hypothetical protein